ncbi:uncharacterized protein A1O9_04450 [Exophiala aquamarina CBS 119918]|uniref:Linalool dehydratase/isomerase domain-containing protein n=1 Tax=Exophiala aquamarina CBS 119918 TaxID=1182545 RepID=A0A072PHI3_9EURO|nr:uncharacterized protein A1O9_04450 [Exophiala aquamarina CBS 119918]KEF59604.1 hypothetical protein A1O9_04450 [Exophiala aquamarina CBS 119918]
MASETIAMQQTLATGPASLPFSLSNISKLSREQAGHLRHFHNLASQKDGQWNYMGAEDPGQEDYEAYRYQIANMVYASSITHYHRLPALRGVFKPLIRRLIHKMLRRDVWGYWFNTSLGGKAIDPSLEKLREPWPDPVIRENIMYSGHLLLMTSLYAMLFDDDEFEKPGSIVFDWNPLCWGLGPEKFTYSNPELQKIIVAEMEKNGWLGVCCEPNLVFIICNQYPLIAIRYNDIRNKTSELDPILMKYLAAWKKKGMIGPTGLFSSYWVVKQDHVVRCDDLLHTAWAGTVLNTWNSDLVKSLAEKQLLGFITKIDGKVRLQTANVGNAIRKLGAEKPQEYPVDSARTVLEAVALTKNPDSGLPDAQDKNPVFGHTVEFLSELGREDLLSGLLDYADACLRPIWENGGLFYPRQDTLLSENGDWDYMDPYTGNTSIGYARLNVVDGQKKMFEKPWTSESLAQAPYVDNVDLSQGVDFLRGEWVEEHAALVVTMRSWDGKTHRVVPQINNLHGNWAVYICGRLQREEHVSDGTCLRVPIEVGPQEEMDLVLLRV